MAEDGFELLAEVDVDGDAYSIVRLPVDSKLTDREKEVAVLAGCGLPNKEIGDILGISEFTVASHLRRIYRKLEVNSRAALGRRTVFFS